MASLIVLQGRQRIGVQASQATGTPTYSATRHIQTMSVDDSSNAFATGDTALNSGGAVTNEYDSAFDATPTLGAGTSVVTHVMTIPTGSGNFTIRRIALHDDTATNVTTSSATLVGGVDAQSLTKTADFTIAITLRLSYSSV